MKFKTEHISEVISFIALGILFIVYAFIGTSISQYGGSAKIYLFITLGLASLALSVIDLVVNSFTKDVELKNYFFGLLLFAGLLEGMFYLVNKNYFLPFALFFIQIIPFTINLIYDYYKRRERITTLDQYFTIGLTFAGFLFVILYLITRMFTQQFEGAEYVLKYLVLILVCILTISFTTNLITRIINSVKFDLKVLKSNLIIFGLIFLGCFFMTNGFSAMFYHQTDFVPTLFPICTMVLGAISILFAPILFVIIRKNQNNKKFDDFYTALIFLSIVEIGEFIIFCFSGRPDFLIIPWILVVITPLITCLVKHTFSDNLTYDNTSYFEFASTIAVIFFIVSVPIYRTVYYLTSDSIYLGYLIVLIVSAIISILSIVSFMTINVYDSIKGNR